MVDATIDIDFQNLQSSVLLWKNVSLTLSRGKFQRSAIARGIHSNAFISHVYPTSNTCSSKDNSHNSLRKAMTNPNAERSERRIMKIASYTKTPVIPIQTFRTNSRVTGNNRTSDNLLNRVKFIVFACAPNP